MKSRKFLITGGNGFIGQKLIEALVPQGHSIRILSRRTSGKFSDSVQVVKGDLTDQNCPLEQFVKNGEVLIHCAGEFHNVAVMRTLHVEGTKRLLQAVLKESAAKKRRIHWVQLSSIGAYGYPPEYIHAERVVTEETPSQPLGEYEVTKTISDELVLEAEKSGLISYSIVRPSKVFGADKFNPSLNSLGEVVRKRLFFYIGRPGAVATYVHVNDVVKVLQICASDVRAQNKIFNISNDCLLEDMINGIASAVGISSPWLRLPEFIVRTTARAAGKFINCPLKQEQINGLIRRTRYPYTKLEQELGFIPTVSVPQSIGEAVLIKRPS